MAETPAPRPTLALIASDQEWSSRSLESILAPHGYAFLRAYTGRQAVELASETTPDVVILDANLPDIPGVEVCRTVRGDPRISASTPILMASAGRLTRKERLEAHRAGAWGFLSWPLDAEETLLRLDLFVKAKLEADNTREESLVDPLTGLYNLRGLMRRARELGADAYRNGRPLACVAFAPQVEKGNGAPDQALWAAVDRLGRVFRAAGRISDAIGRLRLGEFVVVAPATDDVGAMQLAQRLLHAVETAAAEEGQEVPTLKILAGYDAVSDVREAGIQPAALLAGATTALRRSQAEPAGRPIRRYDGSRDDTLPFG